MFTATDGKYTINISYDIDYDGPRMNYDNLGTMACWHRRYTLGDKNSFDEPSDCLKFMKENHCIFLPLYLLDHSGITMNTAGFADPWDSGQVGWIYVTADKVRQEYGWKRITKKRVARITEYLKSEVEE